MDISLCAHIHYLSPCINGRMGWPPLLPEGHVKNQLGEILQNWSFLLKSWMYKAASATEHRIKIPRIDLIWPDVELLVSFGAKVLPSLAIKGCRYRFLDAVKPGYLKKPLIEFRARNLECHVNLNLLDISRKRSSRWTFAQEYGALSFVEN